MVSSGDAIGAYRIVSALGTGGMGQVWLAEHALLGRRVAIKLLRPELSDRADIVERFFDEAKAAAQIDDAGIVQVHDFGRHAGSAYIVMDYLVGEELSARLARVERLPIIVATRLTVHAAMTMAVAHGRGIVHRDLKPDNLFIVSDGAVTGGERVKILDFGIAKLLVDHDAATRTQTGAILGTPMYMSPEQCRNAGTVDHRTDIYALGCVLFHLLCGRPPFTGESSGDLIAAHLVDTPVAASSLAAIPQALDAIITRCLAKSPGDRFGSMTELARALAPFAGVSIDIPTIEPLTPQAHAGAIGFLTTLGTGAGQTQRVPTVPARSVRRIAIWAAITVAAFATVVLAMRTGNEGVTQSAPQPSAPVVAAPAVDAKPPDAPPAITHVEPPSPPPSSPIKPPAKHPPKRAVKSPVKRDPQSTIDRDDGAYDFE